MMVDPSAIFLVAQECFGLRNTTRYFERRHERSPHPVPFQGMSKFFQAILSLSSLVSIPCFASNVIDIDRQSGRIYRVHFEEKYFEIITSTAYDPTGQEGQTRHTVYWDENTTIQSVDRRADFADLKGENIGTFFYLEEQERAAIKAGKTFSARNLEVLEAGSSPSGFSNGERSLVARFTPKDRTSAEVIFEDKKAIFKLGRRSAIDILRTESEEFLKHELFHARVFGEVKNDRFVASQLRLSPLPDPRRDEDPSLPRFLIIGDSISMNYNDAAREALDGVVNFHRISENGGPTTRALESLDLWLGDYEREGFQWDVIQFNHGLHDLRQTRAPNGSFGEHAVGLKDYQKNLEEIVAILKKSGASIIWCNTTPVPSDLGNTSGRRKDEEIIYNQAALDIISQHPEILITDLNKTVRDSPVFDEWRKGDNVHFYTEEERKALGDAVAATVKRAIE